MSRPACANPANIRHVVKPYPDNPTGRYCFQECACGDIVSGAVEGCQGHEPHPDGCTCEITPVACLDCDAEFLPVDPDDDICAACIAKATQWARDSGRPTDMDVELVSKATGGTILSGEIQPRYEDEVRPTLDDVRRKLAFWARLGMVVCGLGAVVMTVLGVLLMIKLT